MTPHFNQHKQKRMLFFGVSDADASDSELLPPLHCGGGGGSVCLALPTSIEDDDDDISPNGFYYITFILNERVIFHWITWMGGEEKVGWLGKPRIARENSLMVGFFSFS